MSTNILKRAHHSVNNYTQKCKAKTMSKKKCKNYALEEYDYKYCDIHRKKYQIEQDNIKGIIRCSQAGCETKLPKNYEFKRCDKCRHKSRMLDAKRKEEIRKRIKQLKDDKMKICTKCGILFDPKYVKKFLKDLNHLSADYSDDFEESNYDGKSDYDSNNNHIDDADYDTDSNDDSNDESNCDTDSNDESNNESESMTVSSYQVGSLGPKGRNLDIKRCGDCIHDQRNADNRRQYSKTRKTYFKEREYSPSRVEYKKQYRSTAEYRQMNREYVRRHRERKKLGLI